MLPGVEEGEKGEGRSGEGREGKRKGRGRWDGAGEEEKREVITRSARIMADSGPFPLGFE